MPLVAFEDRALLVLVLRAGRRNFEDPKREDRHLDLRDSHYWVREIYFASFQQGLVLKKKAEFKVTIQIHHQLYSAKKKTLTQNYAINVLFVAVVAFLFIIKS